MHGVVFDIFSWQREGPSLATTPSIDQRQPYCLELQRALEQPSASSEELYKPNAQPEQQQQRQRDRGGDPSADR